MATSICFVASEAFHEKQVVNLYKSQVLPYIESGTPGYDHAASTILRLLDRVQERLCRELDVNYARALEQYKLAPLMCRRDMAVMGFFYTALFLMTRVLN